MNKRPNFDPHRMQVRLDTASTRAHPTLESRKSQQQTPGRPASAKIICLPAFARRIHTTKREADLMAVPMERNHQFDIAPLRPVSGSAHQFCSPARIGGFFFHE